MVRWWFARSSSVVRTTGTTFPLRTEEASRFWSRCLYNSLCSLLSAPMLIMRMELSFEKPLPTRERGIVLKKPLPTRERGKSLIQLTKQKHK